MKITFLQMRVNVHKISFHCNVYSKVNHSWYARSQDYIHQLTKVLSPLRNDNLSIILEINACQFQEYEPGEGISWKNFKKHLRDGVALCK